MITVPLAIAVKCARVGILLQCPGHLVVNVEVPGYDVLDQFVFGMVRQYQREGGLL